MQLKHKKKYIFYAEGTVNDWTYQNWFVKFWVGDFTMKNAPQWGRPAEVDSNQIKTLSIIYVRYSEYVCSLPHHM